MKDKPSYGYLWVLSTFGALLGYGLLHPFAMYIYDVFKEQGLMLMMGLPFALIGAVAGLLLGLWLVNRRKRNEAEQLVERLQKQLIDYGHKMHQ